MVGTRAAGRRAGDHGGRQTHLRHGEASHARAGRRQGEHLGRGPGGRRMGRSRPLDPTVNALPHHWQFAVGPDAGGLLQFELEGRKRALRLAAGRRTIRGARRARRPGAGVRQRGDAVSWPRRQLPAVPARQRHLRELPGGDGIVAPPVAPCRRRSTRRTWRCARSSHRTGATCSSCDRVTSTGLMPQSSRISGRARSDEPGGETIERTAMNTIGRLTWRRP